MKIITLISLLMLFLTSCTKIKTETKALYIGSINGKEFSGSIGLVLNINNKIISGYVIGNGGHPFMISKISSDSEKTVIECPIGVLGKAFTWVLEIRIIKTDSPEFIETKIKFITLKSEPTIDVLLIQSGIKALQ